MVKNLPANVGDIGDKGLIPGLGRSSREGYSKLLMDSGAWRATVRGVTKESDTS